MSGGHSHRIMAGYPVRRRTPRRLIARTGHTSIRPAARPPGADNDDFMNTSPVSTCGRQPSARTLAVTESEHPASATTRHPVHIEYVASAFFCLPGLTVCRSTSSVSVLRSEASVAARILKPEPVIRKCCPAATDRVRLQACSSRE